MQTMSASTLNEIAECVGKLRSSEGPCLLEIKCNAGHRKNLGRPTRKPVENKSDFMHFLALS
jgi:phosphonopyruvate decarboxylase